MSARLAASRAPRSQARWVRAWPIYPLVIFILAVFVYPVGQILWLSLRARHGGFTLENYARIGHSAVFVLSLGITLKIAFATTIFSLLAGYPVAYMLATARPRVRDTLTILVLMPFWTSFLVRTFAWMILLGRHGPVNNLLIFLGLTQKPLNMIFNFEGVMIGMVQALMPLAVLTMLSVMQRIDLTLSKAAGTLGARTGQAFWRIYFPLSAPGIAAAGLLVFVSALGFFITPALLGGRHETMLAQIIISVVQQLMDWRFAGALSVVLLAAAALIFLLYDRLVGISTLSGGDIAAGRSSADRPGLVSRAGAALGRRAVVALGSLSDLAERAAEAALPPRADRQRRAFGRAALAVVVAFVLAYLCLPSLFVIPVSFTSGQFINFPPDGFSLRWYHTYLDSPVWVNATIRSFIVAIGTGVLATLLGTAAGFVLVRQRVPGRAALLSLILAPLVLPRIILAVGLFYLYARIGLVGTVLGLVLGHTVLAVPYVVITIMAVLRTYDERLDHAALSLGANQLSTLLRITLPQIRGGIIAGFLFAFITSFDDLTIALFVSGGASSTLPRQMWSDLLLQVNPTLAAVSTVILVFVTLFILAAEALRRRGAIA